MNRADIEKLVDDELVLYHGSSKPLPVGKTLKAKKAKQYRLESTDIIDQYRPETAPPRWGAWFMVDDPCDILSAGGDPSFTYEVSAPHPHRANYEWLEKFLNRYEERGWPPRDSASLLKKYWSAAPSPDSRFEYLAPEIKIVRRVKTCMDQNMGGDWISKKVGPA